VIASVEKVLRNGSKEIIESVKTYLILEGSLKVLTQPGELNKVDFKP